MSEFKKGDSVRVKKTGETFEIAYVSSVSICSPISKFYNDYELEHVKKKGADDDN